VPTRGGSRVVGVAQLGRSDHGGRTVCIRRAATYAGATVVGLRRDVPQPPRLTSSSRTGSPSRRPPSSMRAEKCGAAHVYHRSPTDGTPTSAPEKRTGRIQSPIDS